MSYCITLLVTAEQENAIIDLFRDRCWVYVKTGEKLCQGELLCNSKTCLFSTDRSKAVFLVFLEYFMVLWCHATVPSLVPEPRHEKACLRGFRPGNTQTCLVSNRG